MQNQQNKMQKFLSENFGTVRAVMQDGTVYFNRSDIAQALGYKNAKDMTDRLKDDEMAQFKVPTAPDGKNPQPMQFISEAGLYHLILTANPQMAAKLDPEAVEERMARLTEFRKWVTGVVIPSVVKNGGYETGQEDKSAQEQEEIAFKHRFLRDKVQDQLAEIRANSQQLNELGKRLEAMDNEYANDVWNILDKSETYMTTKAMVETILDGVRTYNQDGVIYFAAADVAAKLGYDKASNMTRALDSDEVDKTIALTTGGFQEVSVVTEAGIYHAMFVAMPSRSPTASLEEKEARQTMIDKFKHTVTHNILPAAREGVYIDRMELLPEADRKNIRDLATDVAKFKALIGEQYGTIETAMETLQEISERAQYEREFKENLYELQGEFGEFDTDDYDGIDEDEEEL